ncbi:MAG TPA: ABC transporter permease [Blastocatellia bacterium]|nr:ABC transporter permease [Blastocatellia bacterium]
MTCGAEALGALWDALLLQPRRLEDEMFQDLRFGLRMLLKQKSFTTIAVVTLALGIGANTAIFSVINAVLLRPLPFAEAEQLVLLWETYPTIPKVGPSYLSYQDWRAQAQSFADLAVHSDRLRNALLVVPNESVLVQGAMVSSNFFSLLGLQPVLGRTFLPEEDQPGRNQIVLLSAALWQRSFARDPNIIGKSVQINETSYTVIGVLGTAYPLEMDVWLPLSRLDAGSLNNRAVHATSTVMGRLKPGVSIEQARHEMQGIIAQLAERYPVTNGTSGVLLLPLHQHLVGNVRPMVLLVFAAVALILLIACANVANLLLAQSAGRRRELAMRAALGAARGRLVRQMLTESLLLALSGGVAGMLLARACVPLLRSSLLGVVTETVPGLEAMGIDWRTLAFTFGATLFAGLLFGVLPALQLSRLQLNDALKEGGKSATGRRDLSRVLVVVEVALAVIVLIGAGLLVRSFNKLLQVDPGFRTDHLLSQKIELPVTLFPKEEQWRAFYQQLMPRIEALPGVEAAGLIDRLPFAPALAISKFVAEGQPHEIGKEPLTQMRGVDHRFFQMLKIPLRSGRFFTEAEVVNPRNGLADDNPVIINETMARRFFPQQDVVGRRIFMHWGTVKPTPVLIVGVVADIKDLGLDKVAEPEIYWPGMDRLAMLVVRTKVEPLSLAAAVRQTILSLAPQMPVPQARTMDDLLAASLARRRFTVGLLGAMGLLALALAVIGIYGVVAYSVTQRTQEIGIRRALGAQTRDILQLVIKRGMIPASLGVVFGLLGATALSRWLTSLTADLLFDVRTTDPLTFAATAALLLFVTLLACWIPARRAAKVDPLTALRHE